ncbi:MAG TPA: hypothetical protein VGK29_04290 [Paludibaculum sp.]|jgi:hypothetical protein
MHVLHNSGIAIALVSLGVGLAADGLYSRGMVQADVTQYALAAACVIACAN